MERDFIRLEISFVPLLLNSHLQDHAGNELPRATAVHSHLSTKDVVTIAAHRRTTNDLGVL